MTTATIDFDQPTLFKEGRFTRDSPPSPAPPSERDGAPDPPSERDGAPDPPSERAAAPAPPSDPAAAAPAPAPATDRAAAHPASRPHGHAPRERLTLDEVLSAAWDGLAAHHSVTCPVCSGSMAPRYGSGAAPVGGRCKRCGSTLG